MGPRARKMSDSMKNPQDSTRWAVSTDREVPEGANSSPAQALLRIVAVLARQGCCVKWAQAHDLQSEDQSRTAATRCRALELQDACTASLHLMAVVAMGVYGPPKFAAELRRQHEARWRLADPRK